MKRLLTIVSLLAASLSSHLFAESNSVSTGTSTETFTDADPISASSGAFFETWGFLNLGGPMALHVEVHYKPELRNQFPSNMFKKMDVIAQGMGGVFATNHHLEAIDLTYNETGQRTLTIFFGDREESFLFDAAAGFFRNTSSIQYDVKIVGSYYYVKDPRNGWIYIFKQVTPPSSNSHNTTNWWGQVETIIDRNGNRLNYHYDASDQIIRVDDGLGRSLNFSYEFSGNSRVSRIEDSNGRSVNFTGENYSYLSMTDPAGNTTSFEYSTVEYDDFLMTKITRPLGNTPISQVWRETHSRWYPGIDYQEDAYGNRTTLNYEVNEEGFNDITFTFPNGVTSTTPHARMRLPTSTTDRMGNQSTFDYNDENQLTRITDRLGATTSLAYDPISNRVASYTDAEGNREDFQYTAQNHVLTNPVSGDQVEFVFYNLTSLIHPDGSSENFTYDERGNLVSRVDSKGNSTNYSFNQMGLPISITLPVPQQESVSDTGVVTLSYNEDGTLAAFSDNELHGRFEIAYDAMKRPINRKFVPQVNPDAADQTPPDLGQVDITYDSMDRITSIKNEMGHTTQYQWDANGNLANVIDPVGALTAIGYDLMDRVASTTNRVGATTTVNYDWEGNIIVSSDANGGVDTFTYDQRGWLRSSGRNGKTSVVDHDAEGILLSRSSPSGKTVNYQSNNLGQVMMTTTAGGSTTQYAYDSMSRLVSVTDSLQEETVYEYDSEGFLTSVTLPDGNAAHYHWNHLGKLAQLSDLNEQNWLFAYTPMGKLGAVIDPLGETTQFGRDDRGRTHLNVFADGATRVLSFDNAGRVVGQIFSDGLILNNSYDTRSNLIQTNNLDLAYDSEERITSSAYNGLLFGVTYDAGGRIATVTYGEGFVVSYQYNADNQLERVSDNLGNWINFAYDIDGRLTGVGRSNNINASCSWDQNGHLLSLQDGDLINLQYEYDAVGRLLSTSGNMPLDPGAFLVDEVESYTYDAASQVSQDGYVYDVRGRVTSTPQSSAIIWDDASRISALDDAHFIYNGLDEIVSRTSGGTTVHYHHNHALGLQPIVAEEGVTGMENYYIYSPSGELLYQVDLQNGNAVAFYHRDHIGSILALSSADGSVTDRYAYSPYGKMLAHEGLSTQPFTFVGTLGVRKEGVLYQMGHRYYDPKTAKFLSREPIWPQLESPEELNPYQYARNNPVSYSDVSGKTSEVTYYSVLLPDGYIHIPGKMNWEKPGDLSGATSDESNYVKGLQSKMQVLENERMEVFTQIQATIWEANQAIHNLNTLIDDEIYAQRVRNAGEIFGLAFEAIGMLTKRIPIASQLASAGEHLSEVLRKEGISQIRDAIKRENWQKQILKWKQQKIRELNVKNRKILAKQRNLNGEVGFANEMLGTRESVDWMAK